MVAGPPFVKIYLKRDGDNLVPLSSDDHEAIKRIKDGQIIYVDYKKPRNPLFHKKFMAMMRVVFENQEEFSSIDNIVDITKVELGYYTTLISGNITIRIPGSISFAKMDELKFDHFYNRAIAVCLTRWFPHNSKSEVEQYMEQIEGFAR